MALISLKNNKKAKNNLIGVDRVEMASAGNGFVKRIGKFDGTLSNRTGLINGLTIQEQDPKIRITPKSKKDKPKAGASQRLLKKE